MTEIRPAELSRMHTITKGMGLLQRQIGTCAAGLEVAESFTESPRFSLFRRKTSVMKKTTALAGLFAATLVQFGAYAASQTASLTVSATVTNNCTISTAALSFASYDPVVGNATANL